MGCFAWAGLLPWVGWNACFASFCWVAWQDWFVGQLHPVSLVVENLVGWCNESVACPAERDRSWFFAAPGLEYFALGLRLPGLFGIRQNGVLHSWALLRPSWG